MRHTAIAETGMALTEILRTYMVPEVIENPDRIGLCSPADKGDLVLCVFISMMSGNARRYAAIP